MVSSRMARSWLDLYTSLALHSHMRAATRRYHCAGLQTAARPRRPAEPHPCRPYPDEPPNAAEPPRGAEVPCCAVVSIAVSGILMPVRHTNRTESSTKQPAAQLSAAPRGLTTQHTSWRAPLYMFGVAREERPRCKAGCLGGSAFFVVSVLSPFMCSIPAHVI